MIDFLLFQVSWNYPSKFADMIEKTSPNHVLLPPCFTDGIRFVCWNAVFSFFYRWCFKVKPKKFCNRLIHLQSTAQTAFCFLHIMCGECAPTLHSDDTLMNININMGYDNHTLIDLWPAREKAGLTHTWLQSHWIKTSDNKFIFKSTANPSHTFTFPLTDK